MIVYGAFKGMGDLLNAAPVIAQELDAGHVVKLLVFPGFSLESFVKLLDLGPNHANLDLVFLPVSGRPTAVARFLSQMSKFRPDLVWISPHAPEGATWKIPLLLWLTKKMFWHRARLAGAGSERLSFLFDERVEVTADSPSWSGSMQPTPRWGGSMSIPLSERLHLSNPSADTGLRRLGSTC